MEAIGDCLQKVKSAIETKISEKTDLIKHKNQISGLISPDGRKTKKRNFNYEVTQAIDSGDLKVMGNALTKNNPDELFETRQAIGYAVNGGNGKLHNIDYALNQLEKHEITSAKIESLRHKTTVSRLKRSLECAMNSKNLTMLDCFDLRAFNEKTKSALGTVLTNAIKLQKRLTRVKCVRLAIIQMDDATLSQIYSISHPAAELQDTMAATFLLLGKSSRDVNKWSNIQKYLQSKDSKKNFRVLVSKFSGDVSPGSRRKAEGLIDKIDNRAISTACEQALVFYIWTQAMLIEMETQDTTTLQRIFAYM